MNSLLKSRMGIGLYNPLRDKGLSIGGNGSASITELERARKELEAAKTKLEVATNNLTASNKKLEDLNDQLKEAKAGLVTAQANLEKAKLNAAQSAGELIQKLEQAVTDAENQLALAKKNAQDAALAVEAKNHEVEEKQAALDDAQAKLDAVNNAEATIAGKQAVANDKQKLIDAATPELESLEQAYNQADQDYKIKAAAVTSATPDKLADAKKAASDAKAIADEAKKKLDAKKAEVDQLKNDKAAVEQEIQDLNSDVANKGQLQTDVADATQALAAAKLEATKAGSDKFDADAAVNKAQEDLDAAKATRDSADPQAAVDAAVKEAEKAVQEKQDAITELEGKIADAKGDISEKELVKQNVEADVKKAEEKVTAEEARRDEAAAAKKLADENAKKIEDAKKALKENETNDSAVKSAVNRNKSDIDLLKAKVNSIESTNKPADLTPYLKKVEAATKYQPIGEYATQADLSSYAKKVLIDTLASKTDLNLLRNKINTLKYATPEDINLLKEELNALRNNTNNDAIDAITKQLGNYLLRSEADNKYATKDDVQAINGLDSNTVETLKTLAADPDIANISAKVDNVYTKAEVNNKLDEYAKISDIPSGMDLSNYATKAEVNAKASLDEVTNLVDGKATTTYVDSAVANKATKAEMTILSGRVAVLENSEADKLTSDALVGYMKTIDADKKYATKDAVEAVANLDANTIESLKNLAKDLGDNPDLTGLADKINDVYNKAEVNALIGDKADNVVITKKVNDVKDLVTANKQALNAVSEDLAGVEEAIGALATKAEVPTITAFNKLKTDVAVKANASELNAKANASDLAKYATIESVDAKVQGVDNKVTRLTTITMPNAITNAVNEVKALIPEVDITKELADSTYQVKGDYATVAEVNQLKEDMKAGGVDTSVLATKEEIKDLATQASVDQLKTSIENDYAKKVDVPTDEAINQKVSDGVETKVTALKEELGRQYATKVELSNISTLSDDKIGSVVDEKLGTIKDAVQTITNLQSGINDNKSSVQSIIDELSKKATKDEVNAKVDQQAYDTEVQDLKTKTLKNSNDLTAYKEEVKQTLNDKDTANEEKFVSKDNFATWTTDTYKKEIGDIKNDMVSEDEFNDRFDTAYAGKKSDLDSRYQAVGDYVTKADLQKTTSGYLTQEEGDRIYQGVGNYATKEYVDQHFTSDGEKFDQLNNTISQKIDLAQAQSLFAAKDDYIVRSELDTAIGSSQALKTSLNSALQNKNYLDRVTADNLYQTKGNYVTTDQINDSVQAAISEAHVGLSSEQEEKLNNAVSKEEVVLKSVYEAKVKELTDEITALKERATAVKNGPSSKRPLGVATGTMYFDTDLGLPIFWNGIEWINPFVSVEVQ